MKFKNILAAVGVAIISATSAMAVPMTLTHSGSSDAGLVGTLDGVEFSTTGFTITSTADTDDISGVFVVHLTSSIEIDGVGTFDFITQTRTFANVGIVGFSRASGGDLFNGPSGGWDLMSDVSLTGTAALLQWFSPEVETTGGILFFENAAGVQTSFDAVVGTSEVPLPAGGVLLLTGLGGFAAFRRRKGVAA